MKISIIIPIYNVEEYVGKCLDSIFSQGIADDEFEVVAVNDGSPDNSVKVVERYAAKHSNIMIINQPNGGVSVARNTGIDNATGDYITFVDPDDWIGENALAKSCAILTMKGNSDIIVLNIEKSDTHTKIYDWTSSLSENVYYDGVELFTKYKYLRGSVCGGFYRRSFLNKNGLRFPTGVRNGEDTIFFSMCQTYAKKMCFYNVGFYYVFSRPGSASKTITGDNLKFYREGLRVCAQFVVGMSERQACIMEFARYLLYSNLTDQAVKNKVPFYIIKNKYGVLEYLPIQTDFISMKRGKIWLLNFSYRLYFLLARLKSLT